MLVEEGAIVLSPKLWKEVDETLTAQRNAIRAAYHKLIAIQDGCVSPENVNDDGIIDEMKKFIK